MYEIKVEIARELTLGYSRALQHRQNAKFLGITHNLYRALRQWGILRNVSATMMPKAVALQDLAEFKQELMTKATKAQRVTELATLDTLRRKKCRVSAMAQIVEAVKQGSIPCFYIGTRPTRIGDLLVRAADVEPIISASVPRTPTAPEIRARFDLSFYEFQALARHLSRSKNRCRRIHLSSLEEGNVDVFMSRYTGLTAYAKGKGIHYWTAFTRLQRAKSRLLVIPVGGRSKKNVYFVPLRMNKELVGKAA